jgi:hypothetical protein
LIDASGSLQHDLCIPTLTGSNTYPIFSGEVIIHAW